MVDGEVEDVSHIDTVPDKAWASADSADYGHFHRAGGEVYAAGAGITAYITRRPGSDLGAVGAEPVLAASPSSGPRPGVGGQAPAALFATVHTVPMAIIRGWYY